MAAKPGGKRNWGMVLIGLGLALLLVGATLLIRDQVNLQRMDKALGRLDAAATASAAWPSATPSFAPTSSPATATPPASTRPPDTATPAATLTATSAPSPAVAFTPAPIVRIVAPAIKLDAPVVSVGWIMVDDGGEKRSAWETAAYAAGHHKNSKLPTQGGNIVISGHHNIRGEVFRYVVDLQVGDEITLLLEDGHAYTYRVTQTLIFQELGASDAERQAHAQYIGETPDERLTLVTCWPYWTNTHRVIVIAKPV